MQLLGVLLFVKYTWCQVLKPDTNKEIRGFEKPQLSVRGTDSCGMCDNSKNNFENAGLFLI